MAIPIVMSGQPEVLALPFALPVPLATLLGIAVFLALAAALYRIGRKRDSAHVVDLPANVLGVLGRHERVDFAVQPRCRSAWPRRLNRN